MQTGAISSSWLILSLPLTESSRWPLTPCTALGSCCNSLKRNIISGIINVNIPLPFFSYIGYYGVALMSKSYVVLYGSLAAHLCQFLFLGFVENPREFFSLWFFLQCECLLIFLFFFFCPRYSWYPDIDKIYNSVTHEKSNLKKQRAILYEGPSAYFRRDLMVFKNFDPFRAGDIFTVMILAYAVATYLMNLPTWFYVV